MSRQVFIHAGAHRTGTSSFQLCLAANRDKLASHGFGVAYPGRDGAPGGKLRMRLPRPRHSANELPAFVGNVQRNLSKYFSDKPTLVLSEENLPGVIMHYFKGKLYHNCRTRSQVVKDALDALDVEVAHVLFVVRPYDKLFISGFRKHAEDNPVKPFADYAENMSKFAGGWPATLRALSDVLAPKQLTVVDYAARGQSRDLLARLVGGKAGDFAEPERDLNTSATDAAMEHLQGLYHANTKLGRAEWQAVIREFAGQTEDRGFTTFSTKQKERLDARYAADVATLAAMDNITFVTK